MDLEIFEIGKIRPGFLEIPPEMDIGRRAAEIVASRLFLTLSDDSLGFFIPVRVGRKGFYRRADRFRPRSGPRAAVVMSPEAPKGYLK